MNELQKATFASGCFWCTEALFQRLRGVESVTSGYSGGEQENSYEEVSSGRTGHAESIQVEFDPSIISYDKLLDIFFATHDPTTKDRQGADVGTQYRSAIFYHDENQQKTAEDKIKELEDSGKYDDPIVTEINKYHNFYPAEDHHQDFYNNNQGNNYCIAIIDPKINKLLEEFASDIDESKT